jgi:glycosyltransferase involved in cell wall biosynthesis
MKHPRISIITPSFNQAQFLERTICSVLDQQYPNLEYFVMDGGSTDGSVEIIRKYEKHLTSWISEKDAGQTDAINKGLSRCTGDIVAYINSDDVYLPNTLHHIAKLMSGPNAANWVIGQCRQIDENDKDLGAFEHSKPTSFLSYLCRESGLLPQPSSFWHADFFNDEFNCRLLAHGQQPTLTDHPTAGFRMWEQSKGGSQPIRFGLERIEVARRYELMLGLHDRIKLIRNMGYRQRAYAIQQAKLRTGASLWSQVVTKPWWLASSDIRQALIHPEKQAA